MARPIWRNWRSDRGLCELSSCRCSAMLTSAMARRTLRSLLFAPGNQPKLVGKVGTFGADAVILDLEDAVPLAEKAATRPSVRAALSTLPAGPARYVRVNAVESGLAFDDL